MGTQYQPNQIRGHADECDGIEEYDNKLPTWWVGLLVFTIIWSVVVFVDWHVVTPQTLAANYNADVAEAIANAPPQVNVDEIEIVMSDEAIAAGETVFLTTCASCHQADGTGGIGPDLTDAEWVHGGSPEEIRNTIAHGVLDKGMPAWLPVIGADGLANVTAFVASLSQ